MGRTKAVHQKGRNFYYVACRKSERFWIPLGNAEDRAMAKAARFDDDAALLSARIARIKRRRKLRATMRAPAKCVARNAADPAQCMALHRYLAAQAKLRNIHFAISENELREVVERSDGTCAITGIRFALGSRGKGRKRPWAPSVDRIDSAKGYTPDNVRLVCVAVNLAMNEFGFEALERIAIAIVSRRREAFRKRIEEAL